LIIFYTPIADRVDKDIFFGDNKTVCGQKKTGLKNLFKNEKDVSVLEFSAL